MQKDELKIPECRQTLEIPWILFCPILDLDDNTAGKLIKEVVNMWWLYNGDFETLPPAARAIARTLWNCYGEQAAPSGFFNE